MDLETLRSETEAGRVDTVLVAAVDMQGRLQGKRLTAKHFLDEVVEHDAGGCSYLLAVDVEMNTVGGYEMTSWAQGYGDFAYKPDLETLRYVPWHECTAMVMCDLELKDGTPVLASPRHLLKSQLGRLAERGLEALVGTELEFLVFRDTYQEAWRKGYRDLEPATRYNVNYSLLDTARLEPLLRRIRNSMVGAGLPVETAVGECNSGQHEINLRFGTALAVADGHAIYKNGAKEIAAQEGYSISFMPKFDEDAGNSCHIHLSLRDREGDAAFAGPQGLSKRFQGFLAGQLACVRELMLFFAPNINSYKRYSDYSAAPTRVAWGRDNRTCAFRIVGQGSSLRIENRVPGGDANPYLAIAAMLAAGIHGMDRNLALEEELAGDAYAATGKPSFPKSLQEARELFANGEVVREAFGEEVVDHYLNMARVEIEAFEAAVTDWERYRNFERT
ncbi:MAG TPA: glutamine synthetase family protein [Rubrobacteraceae bacterium]|nr:glutamine synthetase family protein [Rubrobacteraceae bacterium]